MVRLGDLPPPQLWNEIVNDLSASGIVIDETPLNWKQFADDNAFRRQQLEGIEAIIDHEDNYFSELFAMIENRVSPLLQIVTSWLYPTSDIFTREPLLPWAAILMLFFMLRSRIRFSYLLLLLLFILNVTPLYALLVFLAVVLYSHRQTAIPKGFTNRNRIARHLACGYNFEVYSSNSKPLNDTVYDHILLGSSVSTYFCASILAIVGKKVLVVLPSNTPAYVAYPKNADRPITVTNLTTGMPERYQSLLDTIYDRERRLELHPVGGDSGVNTIVYVDSDDKPQIFAVGSGTESFVNTLMKNSSASDVTIRDFLMLQQQEYDNVATYLMGNIHKRLSPRKDTFSRRTCDSVLNRMVVCLKSSDATISPLLHLLPSLHCRQSMTSTQASAITLYSALLTQRSGGYYVAGGMPRVQASSSAAIRRSSGRVIAGVTIKQLAMNGDQCEGVVLADGTVIKAKCGVISGIGAMCTYTRLLPSELMEKCTSLLANVCELRPKIKILLRVHGPTVLGADTMLIHKGDIDPNKCIYGNTLWIWSPTMKNAALPKRKKDPHIVVVEMEAGDALVTLSHEPCQHYKIAAAASIQSSSSTGIEIALSEQQQRIVCDVSMNAVLRMYPSAKLEIITLLQPLIGGHALAATTAKFSSDICAESPVKGLLLCGEDISTSGFAGELQGAWMAASAALGYTQRDIDQKRNIIHDIRQFFHRTLKKPGPSNEVPNSNTTKKS